MRIAVTAMVWLLGPVLAWGQAPQVSIRVLSAQRKGLAYVSLYTVKGVTVSDSLGQAQLVCVPGDTVKAYLLGYKPVFWPVPAVVPPTLELILQEDTLATAEVNVSLPKGPLMGKKTYSPLRGRRPNYGYQTNREVVVFLPGPSHGGRVDRILTRVNYSGSIPQRIQVRLVAYSRNPNTGEPAYPVVPRDTIVTYSTQDRWLELDVRSWDWRVGPQGVYIGWQPLETPTQRMHIHWRVMEGEHAEAYDRFGFQSWKKISRYHKPAFTPLLYAEFTE